MFCDCKKESKEIENNFKQFLKECEKGDQYILLDGWLPVKYKCSHSKGNLNTIDITIGKRWYYLTYNTDNSIFTVLEAIKNTLADILRCNAFFGYEYSSDIVITSNDYYRETEKVINAIFKSISEVNIGDLYATNNKNMLTLSTSFSGFKLINIYKVTRISVIDKEDLGTYSIKVFRYNYKTREFIEGDSTGFESYFSFLHRVKKIESIDKAFDLYKDIN